MCVRVPVLIAIITIFHAAIIVPAFAEPEFFMISKLGNTFPVEILISEEAEGGADSIASLTRIDTAEYSVDDMIIFGDNANGEISAVKPYISMSNSTKYVAYVFADHEDNLEVGIPHVWKNYEFNGNSLVDLTGSLSNLISQDGTPKVMNGSVSVSSGGGITINGNGEVLFKINDSPSMLVETHVTSGTADIRIVESSIITPAVSDLTDLTVMNPYKKWRVGEKAELDDELFVLKDMEHKPVNSLVCKSIGGSTNYALNVVFRNIGYDVIPGSNLGILYYLAESKESRPKSQLPPKILNIIDVTERYHDAGSQRCNYSDGVRKYLTSRNFEIVSRQPWVPVAALKDGEKTLVTNPDSVQRYIYANLDNANVTITALDSNSVSYLHIKDVPPDTPYRVELNGNTEKVGIVDGRGIIQINTGPEKIVKNGILYLYAKNSMMHRGSFDTIVFDIKNETKMFPNHLKKKQAYVVHAYAKVPIITDFAVITDAAISGKDIDDIALPNLDGTYVSGRSINVPIISGYDEFKMTFNGTRITVKFEDVLGQNNVILFNQHVSKTGDVETAREVLYKNHEFGVSKVYVSTASGTLNSIISSTFSGNSKIVNKYLVESYVPPGSDTTVGDVPTASMSTKFEVFQNGVRVEKGTMGKNTVNVTTTGDSDLRRDDVCTNYSRQGNACTWTRIDSYITNGVDFNFQPITNVASTEFDVKPGDIIEYYVYGETEAENFNFNTKLGPQIDKSSVINSEIRLDGGFVLLEMKNTHSSIVSLKPNGNDTVITGTVVFRTWEYPNIYVGKSYPSGILVYLIGTSHSDEAKSETVKTDSNGEYRFEIKRSEWKYINSVGISRDNVDSYSKYPYTYLYDLEEGMNNYVADNLVVKIYP